MTWVKAVVVEGAVGFWNRLKHAHGCVWPWMMRMWCVQVLRGLGFAKKNTRCDAGEELAG